MAIVYASKAPTIIELEADHYSMLKEPDISELVKVIRYRLGILQVDHYSMVKR